MQSDASAIRAARRAEEAAKASLDIVQKQLNAGQVKINSRSSTRSRPTLTASVTRVQSEANRLSDTAALFMALGGGWPADCKTSDWRVCAMGDPLLPLIPIHGIGDSLLSASDAGAKLKIRSKPDSPNDDGAEQ